MATNISNIGRLGGESASTGRAEQHIIRTLTGRSLPAEVARNVWPWIIEHKWFLSEKLGRDVGLRVAAIDYLENIQPAVLLRAA